MKFRQITTFSMLLTSSFMDAQVKPSRHMRIAVDAHVQLSLPHQLRICEGTACSLDSREGSTLWKFNGLEGAGQFSTGEQPLLIERFDRNSIIVRRHESSGPNVGSAALYAGYIDGDQITGTVTYSANAQGRFATGVWSGKIESLGSPVPSELKMAQARAAVPLERIVECEGTACNSEGFYATVWTLDGQEGTGQFPTGDQPLTVKHYDRDFLIVKREETSGSMVGMTALYAGVIDGNHITGSVRFESKTVKAISAPWYGVIEDPRVLVPEASTSLPTRIIECEGLGPCNGVWTFAGMNGEGFWPTNTGLRATLQIDRFDRGGVSIRVLGTSPAGLTGFYVGKLEGNRIVGTSSYLYHPNNTSTKVPFSAVIAATSCVRGDGLKLSVQEANDVGRNATMFKLFDDAKTCYLIGAKIGNPVAQRQLARLLSIAPAPNEQVYREMFQWSKKAAEQGDYFAQRDVAGLYEAGVGVPRDHGQAQFWASVAAENPAAPQESEVTTADLAAEALNDPDFRALALSFVKGVLAEPSGPTMEQSFRHAHCLQVQALGGGYCRE